jgi:hypothetical protein
MPKQHAPDSRLSWTWTNLTGVGDLFDKPAVQVGNQLKALGWRQYNGEPSAQAIEQGLARVHVRAVHMGRGTRELPQTQWHFQKTAALLQGAGWAPKADPADRMFRLACQTRRKLQRGRNTRSQEHYRGGTPAPVMAVANITQRLAHWKGEAKNDQAVRLYGLLTGEFGLDTDLAEVLLSGVMEREQLRKRLLEDVAKETRTTHGTLCKMDESPPSRSIKL